jgi:hypothetical protein
MSTFIGLLGPFSEIWYLKDYWNPLTISHTTIGIEDYLFGFFIGGIACSVYEGVFAKRLSSRHKGGHRWGFLVISVGMP